MKKVIIVAAVIMAAACNQQEPIVKSTVINKPGTLIKDADNVKLAEAYADSIFVRMDIYTLKYTSTESEKAKKAALKEFDRTSKRHLKKLDSLYTLLTPAAAKQVTAYRQTLLDKIQANTFTKDFYYKFHKEYEKENIVLQIKNPFL
jgi:hypothetical protein